MSKLFYISALVLVLFSACGPDDADSIDLTDIPYTPQSYLLEQPPGYPDMDIPADNPLTVAGVALGRALFYDPILSIDSTLACSSCHLQAGSFTDNVPFSRGFMDRVGRRSSMSLLDVGYSVNGLFWDGRVSTLEEQALLPVEDDIELAHQWPEVVTSFRQHGSYPKMFREAFGIANDTEITKELAAKAIAQFERTLVSSGNSKYDQVLRGVNGFTEAEAIGHDIFFDLQPDLPDGQCFHCHSGTQFTDNMYHNNGLDLAENFNDFMDKGQGGVTGIPQQNGFFRTPTLRNIAASAPYMHDGRFQTLEEVMDHYVSGGHPSITRNPLIDSISLDTEQKAAVLAFLLTLTDNDFNTNESYADPH